MRLRWVQLYQESKEAGYVCRGCGISRPTLQKWVARYQAAGFDGLKSKSKRPDLTPKTKFGAQKERWVLG